MTLLQTVIEEAQGTGPVPPLLRRLKVLATRTGARSTLLAWTNSELGGYRDEHGPLPPYRGPYPIAPLGNYIGIGWTELTGHRVAPTGFPEALAEALFSMNFTEPIAELEAAAEEDRTNFSWPAEAVNYYNGLIAQGKSGLASHFRCLGVKYTMPRSRYVGILDQVRNLALDLALELDEVVPKAGEPDADEAVNREARQVIEQHFHIEGMSVSHSNLTFVGEGPVTQELASGQE